ncbi:tail fiber protein [bacterium]|nr:tail fiber protein [bacterium]
MNGALGEIRLFAGPQIPMNWQECNGLQLPVAANQELVSILFPSQLESSFIFLPNLAPLQSVSFSSQGMPYMLCVSGSWPLAGAMEGMLGEIRLWAGQLLIPQNWAVCDGALLNISEYQELYSVLGHRYGGDGQQTFALPALKAQPGALYILCITGAFPTSAADSDSAPVEVSLAEVRLWAGSFVPAGFAVLTNPSFYPISQNTLLFDIIDYTYGVGPDASFQLPQLEPLPAQPGTSVSYIFAVQGLYPA